MGFTSFCLPTLRPCAADEPAKAQRPDFGGDILPLLSDRCFHCHGPDDGKREADLRLDTPQGVAAVVNLSEPEKSELLKRVSAGAGDQIMPPRDSHREPLTAEEVERLRDWIAAGIPWGKHWSLELPKASQAVDGNPIDHFVQEQLRRRNLVFSPPAARHTLLRRLCFDLTGLPPTPEQAAAFLQDDSPQAVERLVEQLLSSPHYGERMAMWWLDAARYADTDGYQQDATRTNWPWRDWVVQSFNRNLPYDQFTTEQFAGDLLPEANDQQRLATCFHRNHMTNGEGGRDPEESRVDYVIDRVNTMGTVWLGLTLGCCQCHSHKFDPVTQAEYYQLYAFFNSIDEDGKAGKAAKPYLKYESPLSPQSVSRAEATVKQREPQEAAARQSAEQEFELWLASQVDALAGTAYEGWQPFSELAVESVEGTQLELQRDQVIRAHGPNPRQDDYRLTGTATLRRLTGLRLEVFPHADHTDGKLSRGASGEFILTDVKLQRRRPGSSQLEDIELDSAVADAEKKVSGRNYGLIKDTLDDDPRNGWTTDGAADQPHEAVFALAEPLQLNEGDQLVFVLLQRSTVGDASIGRFRVMVTDQPGEAVRRIGPMPLERLATSGVTSVAEVPQDLRAELLRQFLADHSRYQAEKQRLDLARQQLSELRQSTGPLDVMVLAERNEPRNTFRLVRGIWDQHGEQLQRGFPAAIGSAGVNGESSLSRLDLARWLTSRHNPLTARVTVNHLWQLFFGSGIVRTPEDFGVQGERPTHPELLDHLAVELMEHDWDLRHVIRLIVTSRTYAQSSVVPQDSAARQLDPENRWLSRVTRRRLPSWMIRDAALTASGLLNRDIGGPPVMPYQPAGVWKQMFMGRFQYRPSQGELQYRRTLYAFWRRSSAPVFLFDSAQRRTCEVQPRQTNTPLHALTLLNGETTLEAARELARLATREHPDDVQARLSWMTRRLLTREPDAHEFAVLARQRGLALEHYRPHPGDAAQLLAVGQASADRPTLPDTAAWAADMVVASMLLNLDEAITRE
ncbi:MAG: PSD1 domain-containing protein [Planctomycetales bacterium]|nr:PSD1 domain-containing protein [Planctomycetales bacterium]